MKTQTLILFLFLSTGVFNKSNADTISSALDTLETQKTYFDDEIRQSAEDSLILSIDGKKAFLYGNAKIEYKNTTITAAYIEIDWNKETIYASFKIDSAGNKIDIPVFNEGVQSFKAEEITYNFKTKKCRI